MRWRYVGSALLLCTVPMFAGALAAIKVNLSDASGENVGTAFFAQEGNTLRVYLNLTGLAAGKHGVHIHEGATCQGQDFKSAGGHLNPGAKQHGFDNKAGHHAGDFHSSVLVRADGTGFLSFSTSDLSLTHSENSVVGHTIIVDVHEDDQKTDPDGNSGNGLACGEIPQLKWND